MTGLRRSSVKVGDLVKHLYADMKPVARGFGLVVNIKLTPRGWLHAEVLWLQSNTISKDYCFNLENPNETNIS